MSTVKVEGEVLVLCDEGLQDEVERLPHHGEGVLVVVGGERGQVGEDRHGEDQHVVGHDARQLLRDLRKVSFLPAAKPTGLVEADSS